jgi:hypothetical protein
MLKNRSEFNYSERFLLCQSEAKQYKKFNVKIIP